MDEVKLKKNFIKESLSLLSTTFNQFVDDKAFKLAAALSYYAAFSIGPLLIIVLSIAGFFFGEEAARGQLFGELTRLMGAESAIFIETILKGAANKSTGIFATFFSILLLIIGALGVFIELRESLNIIWGVELKPGRPFISFLKNRLLSFYMVLATGFLLIISLVINTLINLLYNIFGSAFEGMLPAASIVNNVLSFIVVTVLFALIFKVLPDVVVKWKYVWFGAIITSFLFTIGKYLIGLYIGNSSYSSTYGAAASLVILFVWIYYSGLILFFGAEFTQVYRNRYADSPLIEGSDGIKIPKVSELIQTSLKLESKKTTEERNSCEPAVDMKSKKVPMEESPIRKSAHKEK
ncbi:N/A [soil metagenome]